MKFFHENREEKLIELYQLCEIGYCKFKWKHSKKCSFLCFGPDLTQVIGEAEKQNGALMHFVRFCLQLPGIWHLLRTFSSTFAKLSNLLPIDCQTGMSCGCNLWENICDLLPLAGEHIPWNGGKDYFWRQISFCAGFFLLQICQFNPIWSGVWSNIRTEIAQKMVPNLIYISPWLRCFNRKKCCTTYVGLSVGNS